MPSARPAGRATSILRAGAVVAVVLILAAAFTAVHPFTHHVDDAPWDAAVLAADDLALDLTFTGNDPGTSAGDACWEGFEPVVVDAGDHVEVRLERQQAFSARALFGRGDCAAERRTRTVHVQLPAPLGGRPLLDPAENRNRPVFDGNRAATLTALPPGATLVFERAVPVARGAELVRSYQLSGTPDGERTTGPTFEFQQLLGPLPPGGDPTATEQLSINGRPGELVRTNDGRTYVQWADGGGQLRVIVQGDTLSRDQLVAIAEGTRVPR